MKKVGDILNEKRRIPTQSDIEKGLPIRRYSPKSFFIPNFYLEGGFAAAYPNATTLVFLAIAKYANAETQSCFPSYDTIARESGVRNRGTLRHSLRVLEASGILYIRHSKGGSSSNVYVLLDPSNWQLLDRITLDTLKRKRVVSKPAPWQVQKSTPGGITDDTRILRKESPKEIPENAPLKGEEPGSPADQESATEIESALTEIPASTKAMLGKYFSEDQLRTATAEAVARGHSPTSSQVLAAARRLGFEPSTPLPTWYR